MKKSVLTSDLLLKIMTEALLNLCSPKTITYMWNLGRILGLVLMVQIFTGIFLSFHYISDASLAFNSIVHIIYDINCGWLFRFIHTNGASLFFLTCYIHIARGIFYGSYRIRKTWLRGSTIYILLIGTGFLGYVLPWGQMSLWGAIVITNLIRVIPVLGRRIIIWLWGGYRIGTPTLNCFYSLHYILPIVILLFVLLHIIFLHERGSRISVGGIFDITVKTKFDPAFTIKDGLNIVTFILFMMLNLWSPFILMERENSIQANPMRSPIHIVPEWYFLYIYAILRSIPNKVGGVLSLCLAIICIFTLRLYNKEWTVKNLLVQHRALFFMLVSIFILLTWLGGQPVEYPYITLGQIRGFIYFIYFFFEYLIGAQSYKLYK